MKSKTTGHATFSSYIDSLRTDISAFNPSAAIYFMDGYSDSTIILHGSGEVLKWEFHDKNTSIAATKPVLYHEKTIAEGLYIPVPEPLHAISYLPPDTPDRYRQETTMHFMQVVSMNMRASDEKSRLLIGLPYAEKYPEIFFDKKLFPNVQTGTASSYGVVQALTKFRNEETGEMDVNQNGYPARSFFGIFHILETPVGVFFNKIPTQMELQPSDDGKLARNLPPIPFRYDMVNSPVPLYDVKDPYGKAVAHVVAAHHHDKGAASVLTEEAWPFHSPDLEAIRNRIQQGNKK